MKNSPTQRSLALLRADGWTAEVTEKWNPYAKVRQDLFGFIDIVAVNRMCGLRGVLAIQTTSGANLAARRAKVLANAKAREWIAAGNWITLHGWRKVKPRGVKVAKWECRIEAVMLADFQEVSTPEGAK